MIDREARLSQFSIPLIGGSHIGAMSLVVNTNHQVTVFRRYHSPFTSGGGRGGGVLHALNCFYLPSLRLDEGEGVGSLRDSLLWGFPVFF